MKLVPLLFDGFIGAVFAAAVLASLTTFQPDREGWLKRFGWFLFRYALPFVCVPIAVAWLLIGR